MKAILPTSGPALQKSNLFLLPVVAAFLSPLSLFTASAKPVSNEPKTHTLFMGADISVEYYRTFYRVQTVVDGAVIISVDGKDVRVPADWAKVRLKVDRMLKLTSTSATVTQLKGERAYSPGHDPWENFQKGLVKAAIQHGEEAFAATVAADKRYQLELANMGPLEQAARSGTGPSRPDPSSALGRAISAQQQAEKQVVAAGDSFGPVGIEPEGKESFDAIKVTFEVSADQTLNDPYVVILGQVHEKDDKPGTVSNWFYAERLEPIAHEARKVTLLKSGFSYGFEMLDFQVHLYNRGREVATDVAPKRVPLTREEAFTYARIEYVSGNKGATLPAKPFMGKLTKEAKAQLSPELLVQPYYVSVSPEGLPLAAYLDKECSKPVDETMAALIAKVRFYPALAKGRPIDGVAELKFNLLNL